MPLILAIEPDRRQAAQLQAVIKRRLDAELILVETTERALDAIGNRMPDLVLVPALLSPQDDAALAAALRVIAAAAHVQMLTIPVLGSARPERKSGGVLSALRRGKSKTAEPDGCDPAVFAEQIASYLERAEEERPAAPAAETWDLVRDAAAEPSATTETSDDDAVTDPAWRIDSIAAFGERRESRAHLDAEPEPFGTLSGGPDALAMEPVDFPTAEPEPLALDPADPELVEPLAATTADEGVSLALEEAVRALFSDPVEAPPAEAPSTAFEPSLIDAIDVQRIDPIDAPVDPIHAEAVEALIEEETVLEAGTAEDRYGEVEPALERAAEPAWEPDPEPVRSPAAAEAAEQDEWEALEDLITALDAMPLAAIEADADFEWLAPISSEPEHPVEADVVPALETEPASVAEEPDVLPVNSPMAARSEREWVALIESLRHDVERLRSERAEKPAEKPAKKNAAREAARSDSPRQESPRPAAPRSDAPPVDRKAKPIQDEWGFFDPEQCGFAALLAKLDEVTDADESRAPADQPRRNQ